MSTWQQRCEQDGGFVTVMPSGAGEAAGTPCCRLPIGAGQDGGYSSDSGLYHYVDYRSISETLADQAAVVEDGAAIGLGDLVTDRDTFVGAIENAAGKVGQGVVSVASSILSSVAIVGVLGLALYLAWKHRGAA